MVGVRHREEATCLAAERQYTVLDNSFELTQQDQLIDDKHVLDVQTGSSISSDRVDNFTRETDIMGQNSLTKEANRTEDSSNSQSTEKGVYSKQNEDSTEDKKQALSKSNQKSNKYFTHSATETVTSHVTTRGRLSTRTKLWLLTSKGMWFVVGSMLVVVAVIVSHFQHNSLLAGNCTNSTGSN